ncbi:MAG: hypothetical protein PWQ20_1442 [Thermotogaceae bacterium]|nr:hypothetical protein [Thermotogaceae bacterium]MDN5338372.1 hypothetical protein [Thermotogaceae bacterium]
MIFAGIDGGGTKTKGALMNDRFEVLNVVNVGGSNFQSIGTKRAKEVFEELLNKLVRPLNLKISDIDFVYFGIAGADRPRDFEIIDGFLKELNLKAYGFHNDGWIALKSGTIDGPGILVTLGTGSVAFGMNKKGEWKRLGGFWGLLGDWLGGYSLASRAIAVAQRGKDERDFSTVLYDKIKSIFNVSDLLDLIEYEYYDFQGKNDIREKAVDILKVLFESAEEFDGIALEIVWEAAKEILITVDILYKSLFEPGEPFKLVLEGSVLKARYKSLTKMLENALKSRYMVELIYPEHDPVVGALMLAAENLGLKDVENFIIEGYLKYLRRKG